MKRKFTADDAAAFTGAMEFLGMTCGVKTHYEIDMETGRGTVRIWFPGTEVVLHLESIDVRHVRVVERNRQRFPDPPAGETRTAPDHGNPKTPPEKL